MMKFIRTRTSTRNEKSKRCKRDFRTYGKGNIIAKDPEKTQQ